MAAPKAKAPVVEDTPLVVQEPAVERKEVIFVERPGQKAIPKKVGQDPSLAFGDDEGRTVKFFSYHKALVLYKGTEMSFHFDNHMYVTNNASDIAFIRNHHVFGDGVWENKFPKEVIRKFEDDKNFIYRDDDVFVNPD